jgi:hypothetical protein
VTAKGLIQKVRERGFAAFNYRKLCHMMDNQLISHAEKDDSGRRVYEKQHVAEIVAVLKERAKVS